MSQIETVLEKPGRLVSLSYSRQIAGGGIAPAFLENIGRGQVWVCSSMTHSISANFRYGTRATTECQLMYSLLSLLTI